ncbi:hypothetical protein PF005_g13807 [Phytophthora fragariae]|uniref:Uncharacterized protein n=1 Tax=Phytophthora fragariae TaxID=53985 RepID=A0A6A3K879_9STRA|nr:hypothetical protein PF009_g14778 [Phytophthora fragariae]KAE9003726.1 hypothetical protein PF011_g12787 [Phytophthora fragariae]KAE9104061.1 hypothetical protein PF010_g13518 [Phytophthora fragariae]KAE9104257.1 hypothetical protein PF007_g14123 [Phytophthora fragariae]KAE9141929.1 hypothetical protein PF006_g12923 [Phytophthora fragariae]
MAVRLSGWSDAHVSALLELFREHLLLYVYSSDSHFAEMVRAELPEKTTLEIQEMVRSLMLQFGLRLSTKNFRTDVIVANGQEVYVYEHIYESINQLAENRAGGLWLPGELSRFLQKAKQYRELFPQSQDVYFKRIQFWGKSVAETKSKFYALREIYVKEKRRSRQRKGVEVRRLELLKEIFVDVPPRRIEKVDVPSKAPKLWSLEDMEKLVDFLVRITNEIQKTGSSDLVKHVAETLHRTEGSCVNKLADMRDKFRKKSASVRAANLPKIMFDKTSEAYTIFNADWSDRNDPYAFGYLAIKSRCSRLTPWGVKFKCWPDKFDGTASINEGNNAPQPAGMSAITLSANDYAAFVRDIAEQCKWTEKVVRNILRCMQHSIELYRSNKYAAFLDKIASLTPGVTFLDLFPVAKRILTQFEQRFGTLDGFENLVLTALDGNCVATSEQKPEEHERLASPVVDVIPSTAEAPSDAVMENRPGLDHLEEAAGTNIDEGEHGREPDGSPAFGSPAQMPRTGDEDVAIEECEQEQSPALGSPAQTPQTGNEEEIIDECEHEQSPPPGSAAQTPQTGNEDGTGDHSSSTAGKQSSPENTWDDGVDADADLDDDGLDDQSVGSSDNAWSGSNANFGAKDFHHAKDESYYPLSRQSGSESSKKPSKRGKDDQYGKNFDLAKKRRLDENSTMTKDDDDDYDDDEEEEAGDAEDEGYDEGDDDDDYQSEKADEGPLADDDSISSNDEHEQIPHPLQGILDSVGSHIAELQEKKRKLIERKEEREWRRRQHVDHEYRIHLSMHSFASER